MTLYESENDLLEESTMSVTEVDCMYSIGPTVTGTPINSYSGRGSFVTPHISRQRPIPTTCHTPSHMTNGVEDDVEKTMDSICESLGSVDMADDTIARPCAQSRTQDNGKVSHGAQPVLPACEEVYTQDRDGDSMLHMAIIHLKSVLALMFISMSPSYTWLNLRNHLYQTALHLAVTTKQLPVVRRLIVGGADIELRDHCGNTPMHIACRDGFIEGVHHLLEPVRYIETKQNKYDLPYQRIPQNLEIKNYEGLTALHLAASNGHLDIVRLLIEKRADVNGRDVKSGRSILHKACADGNLELVRLLLRCKECDINIRTYDDFTPFDIARARTYERIKYELAVAGARYADEQEEYD